jgi:hypothetical protein
VRTLAEDDAVAEIVGVARQPPSLRERKTPWIAADVACSPRLRRD